MTLPPDNRYHSTREAWETIWHGASVEVELEAVKSARSMETLNAYLPYLAKDAPILEAGSGLSAVVITLRQMGYRVMGLDYAVNALEISRAHTPDLPLYAADVHALPHAENSLGGYLSFGVLEHFEVGMAQPLAEAFRVLKPGAILVLTIPYPNVVHCLTAWRRHVRGVSLLTDDNFFESTYTRTKLTAQVRAAGFEIVRAIPTSHAYTLWGLGGVFRAPGYYRTSRLADALGVVLCAVLPWAFNFSTLVIGRKPPLNTP